MKKDREKAKEPAPGVMDQPTSANGRMESVMVKASLLFQMDQDMMVCGLKIESRVKVNYSYHQKKLSEPLGKMIVSMEKAPCKTLKVTV